MSTLKTKEPKQFLIDSFIYLGAFFKRDKIRKQREENIEREILQQQLIEKTIIEEQLKEESKSLKQKLTKQVNDLLQAEMYDTVLDLVQSGYQLDKDQSFLMFNAMNFYLDNSEWNTLESWLKKGWLISLEQSVSLLLNDSFQNKFSSLLFNKKVISEAPLLSRQIISHIFSPNFNSLYLKTWKDHLNIIDSFNLDSSIRVCSFAVRNHHRHLFQPIKEMNEFIVLCEQYSQQMSIKSVSVYSQQLNIQSEIEFMGNLVHTYFPQEIVELHQTTMQVFGIENIEKIVISKRNDCYSDKPIEQLPNEAKTILQKIQHSYQYICHNITLLNHSQQSDIKDILELKIPNILHHYLFITPDYRESLINHEGKNCTQLMIEELNNIETYFTHIVRSINQHNLNELSAMEKYPQTVKNNQSNNQS